MLGGAAKLGTGANKPGDTLSDLLLGDNERRQQAHDVIASGDSEHLLRPDRIDEFAGGYDRAQANQEALAPHFGDEVRVTILDLGQPLFEQDADALHMIEKAGR